MQQPFSFVPQVAVVKLEPRSERVGQQAGEVP